MKNESITKIITGVKSLPTLPNVVTRLIKITSNPDSTMDDLIDTIQKDPSLSVEILKFANSAFFGRVMGVSSLREAASVLGFSEIRNIVLAKAVFSSFRQVENSEGFSIDGFWEHSFLCGIAAKITAENLRLNASDFFMAGLIHDIGKLIFFLEIPGKLLEAIEAPAQMPFKMFENEKKYIGISHDKAGMLLLNKWLFPENLLSAVRYHHCPGKAKTLPAFPAIVHAADIMAHQLEAGQDTDADMSPVKILTSQEMISLLDSCKIQWNQGIIQTVMEQFTTQKKESVNRLKELST